MPFSNLNFAAFAIKLQNHEVEVDSKILEGKDVQITN